MDVKKTRACARALALMIATGMSVSMASASEQVTVPLRSGLVTFVVDNAGVATSDASRVNIDRADKLGNIPAPSAGYTLTNRIVVGTDDIASLAQHVRDFQPVAIKGAMPSAAASVAAHGSVGGFAVVTSGSIADAAALAAQLDASGRYSSVEMDIEAPRSMRSIPTDPSLGSQWHLINTSNTIADVNADGAWSQGYTGAGVVVGILEGGFQNNHPDLAANYYATASQNSGTSWHGTACGGIAAAVGNNGAGGAGLAYNAQLSEQLYGSSSQTANAFKYRNDLNDIKSNSWGPWDDGTITYLSSVERAAIEESLALGRGGLGMMLAWAAGNGGTGDRVEYDPYASNRYTFAFGAIGDQDREASYNELGSSMLVVTHSSGNNRGTWTTADGSGYTSNFGGTSSASPLGMAAVALALEANPSLTWRDVMHLLVESARKCDPSDSTWTTNATGREISYKFGFGAIDAGVLVTNAAAWNLVGPEVSAATGVQSVGQSIPDNNTTGVSRTINVGDDITLETVELVINVSHTYVGDLEITVTSPSGTPSIVAVRRSDSNDNYNNYIFTSHRVFGESSMGDWTVKVADRGASDLGTWDDYELKFYGTASGGCTNPADLTGDGVIDSGDLGLFISMFLGGDLAVDFTGDGVVDSGDLGEFITLFLAGC